MTGWSEGKAMAASGPRLDQVVTFTPRKARIRLALHAIWNGASITSWYQRQVSQEAGHWLNSGGVLHRVVTVNQLLNAPLSLCTCTLMLIRETQNQYILQIYAQYLPIPANTYLLGFIKYILIHTNTYTHLQVAQVNNR